MFILLILYDLLCDTQLVKSSDPSFSSEARRFETPARTFDFPESSACVEITLTVKESEEYREEVCLPESSSYCSQNMARSPQTRTFASVVSLSLNLLRPTRKARVSSFVGAVQHK